MIPGLVETAHDAMDNLDTIDTSEGRKKILSIIVRNIVPRLKDMEVLHDLWLPEFKLCARVGPLAVSYGLEGLVRTCDLGAQPGASEQSPRVGMPKLDLSKLFDGLSVNDD